MADYSGDDWITAQQALCFDPDFNSEKLRRCKYYSVRYYDMFLTCERAGIPVRFLHHRSFKPIGPKRISDLY